MPLDNSVGDAAGVKLRNWYSGDIIEDSSIVEVKRRAERKKRGAEKWTKEKMRIAELRATKGVVVPAGPPDSWPWVLCNKVRRQGYVNGLVLEQTDCEFALQASNCKMEG